jgi:cation diffusion facilitator family transporter
MRDVKERVALGSIVVAGALALAKAAVGLLSGSLAIVSEATHSLLDFAATVGTYFAVRISGKPADKEHQYGHGKIESVAALAETALLFVLSVAVIWAAMKRLSGGEQGHTVEASMATFIVMAGSIIVDFFRARVLSRTAAATGSQALEADALHFGSDMWSSAAVLVGLAAVALGFHEADAIAALVVAAFVCLAGWRLGKRTIDTLTDVAPDGVAERVGALLRPVKGVVALERVRARPAGAVLFIELSVGVSRTLPLERVASIKTDIVQAVRAEWSQAELTVTTNPRALDNETVLERIMMIARNRGLAVHHVTVHALAGKLSVSLDLEIDGHLGLGVAHEIASGLETAVADELGPDVEVETHIEPLQVQGDSGQDASSDRVAAINASLTEIAASLGAIRDVHEVRVRKTSDGEIVNFHCLVDPAMTVQEVHEKVDQVEQNLRRYWPSIKRVIGHAEPRR